MLVLTFAAALLLTATCGGLSLSPWWGVHRGGEWIAVDAGLALPGTQRLEGVVELGPKHRRGPLSGEDCACLTYVATRSSGSGKNRSTVTLDRQLGCEEFTLRGAHGATVITGGARWDLDKPERKAREGKVTRKERCLQEGDRVELLGEVHEVEGATRLSPPKVGGSISVPVSRRAEADGRRLALFLLEQGCALIALTFALGRLQRWSRRPSPALSLLLLVALPIGALVGEGLWMRWLELDWQAREAAGLRRAAVTRLEASGDGPAARAAVEAAVSSQLAWFTAEQQRPLSRLLIHLGAAPPIEGLVESAGGPVARPPLDGLRASGWTALVLLLLLPAALQLYRGRSHPYGYLRSIYALSGHPAARGLVVRHGVARPPPGAPPLFDPIDGVEVVAWRLFEEEQITRGSKKVSNRSWQVRGSEESAPELLLDGPGGQTRVALASPAGWTFAEDQFQHTGPEVEALAARYAPILGSHPQRRPFRRRSQRYRIEAPLTVLGLSDPAGEGGVVAETLSTAPPRDLVFDRGTNGRTWLAVLNLSLVATVWSALALVGRLDAERQVIGSLLAGGLCVLILAYLRHPGAGAPWTREAR
jgi:hypothetical protein